MRGGAALVRGVIKEGVMSIFTHTNKIIIIILLFLGLHVARI